MKPAIYALAEEYPKKRSLDVDLHSLANVNPDIPEAIVAHPDSFLAAARESLSNHKDLRGKSVRVRFFNLEGKDVLVKDLGAEHLNKLVTVQGVVNLVTDIKPKMQVSLWECVHCGTTVKTIPEKTALKQPELCRCGRRDFTLIESSSDFINTQYGQMQDLIERVAGASSPSHVDLWFEEDLTNKVLPGENIIISGILRLMPVRNFGKTKSPIYAKAFDVVHVRKSEKEFEEIEISPEEEVKIIALSKDPKLREKVVASIAPSIYGYDLLKESMSLQLFGGTPDKVLPDGQKIRSDIHILLIGDPGVAKSRMLQYIEELAPKCIYVAGRGASGVGLCVAPDSLVLQNDSGLKEISQVVESNLNEVKEDRVVAGAFYSETMKPVRVAALNDSFKIGFQTADRVWRIKAPSLLSLVRTRRGKSLTTTLNTPVLRLKDSKVEWVEARNLRKGDFIATSRKLPELNGPAIKLLNFIDNQHVTANDCSVLFKKVSDVLAVKHGSLENAAEFYGVSRDRFYLWRMAERNAGIPLHLLKKMAVDAEIDLNLTRFSVRDGKFIQLPVYADADFFYLLGLVAADGDICRHGSTAGIRIHNNNTEVLSEAKRILSELGLNCQFTQSTELRSAQLRFSSVILAELFGKLGVPSGRKSSKIDLPAVLNNNSLEMRSFIKAVFDCDGFVSLNKGRGSNSVGFSTCSKTFAVKLQLLLEQQGITAKLRLRNRSGKISITKFGSKITSKLDQYYVEVLGLNNLLAFKEKIGFTNLKKAKTLNSVLMKISKPHENLDLIPNISCFLTELQNKYGLSSRLITSEYKKGKRSVSRSTIEKILSFIPENTIEKEFLTVVSSPDVYWDKVVESDSFENTSVPWVYDFTLPSHAFVANGIIVHNTASAEKDKAGEGWVLKAGAMVLASGGLIAIDEFDKMEEGDRASIHEAMEQQSVSVAKAGIVTKFKTKTSVLAAANPKFGRFDPNTPVAQQFDIMPTLLSRFDLIFVMRDVLDSSKDRSMAEHILTGHKVSVRFSVGREKEKEKIKPLIDEDLFRKYIAFSRRTVFPILTDVAVERIKDYYVELRRLGEKDNTFPITPRDLEGLVRMAEASAKLRLSKSVDLEDAETAIRLKDYVLREIFVDKATGRLDVDVVLLGQAKSKVDKIRQVNNLIRDLEKQFDLVPVEEVFKHSTELGLDEGFVQNTLDQLLRQGELYKPKPGFVKSARPKW
ncbi:MAG: LAGLIDADG family homing endonuclease [Candidatus Micrarchaeota archaeon]